jgi:hypothetical protein
MRSVKPPIAIPLKEIDDRSRRTTPYNWTFVEFNMLGKIR